MAKKSSIEKNNRRRRLSKQYSGRRARLKAIARDKTKPMEERFAATLKLAELPRNSSQTRVRIDARYPAARADLPQAQAIAHRTARARLQGTGPRPRQVELVRNKQWQ